MLKTPVSDQTCCDRRVSFRSHPSRKNGRTHLVVTDELTQRVGGEGGLSGSRESEEEGHVAIDSLVSGRVEGELSELDGLEVVLRRVVESARVHTAPRKRAERTMTEKIPFFISPAYSVPRMTISFLLKLTSTDVLEVMPAVKRLAGN